MSFSDFGGSTTSDLPDRALVVKCFFDRSLKRISFSSAVNCTFDRLKTKVEQAFSLSALSFTISYTDDDGEVTAITNDYDLLEAVQYFQAGDDVPLGSGASVSSGRSGLSRRITLRVQVVVDYDGPSLSDTASLASMEDFPRHRFSGQREPSISLSGSSVAGYDASRELDDDAVTVSSRDVHGLSSNPVVPHSSSSAASGPVMPSSYRLPGHSVPSVATSPPSPPPSEPSAAALAQTHSPRPERTVRFGDSPNLDAPQGNPSGTLSESSGFFSRSTELSSTATAVFERLKLAEGRSKASSSSASYVSGPEAFTHNERGVQWLQEQNARALRTIVGEIVPSSSSDASSLMLSNAEMEAELEAEKIRGDLVLQQDFRGRFHYTYTTDNQSGYRDSVSLEQGGSALDRRISTSSQNLAWLANHRAHRISLKRRPVSQDQVAELEEVMSQRLSLVDDRPLPPLPQELTLEDLQKADLPPEVLEFVLAQYQEDTVAPPTVVINCSNCNACLNSFRYVCATCGERPSHPPDEDPFGSSQATVVGVDTCSFDPKGKGKSISPYPDEHESVSDSHSFHYPPRSPTSVNVTPASPSTPSSWSMLSDREHSPFASLSSIFKHKHRGFKKLASKSSFPHSAGSEHSAPSVLSLPETAHDPNGSLGSPTSSRSSKRLPNPPSSFGEGFELCSDCIYTAGVSHSYEGAMDMSASSSTVGGSTLTLSTTPLSSPEDAESSLRRSAPFQRGRTRHAFIEKVWNGSSWIAIEQDDKKVCLHCQSSLTRKRYKCASCPDFDLCRACFGLVHEIHPSHAFLSVPMKVVEPPTPPPSATEQPEAPRGESGDEMTLQHPGVQCYNCGLGIFGARFHCAVCESVDICQNCESAGLPGNLTTTTEGGHDSSHIMIKIPYPLESTEVAIASRRARVLWSERDAATIDATTKRITPRSRSNSVDSAYATTVIPTARRGASDPLDHRMRCNGCNNPIIGVRYQCANCPSYPVSYNLCHECEQVSFSIHPLPHVFIKFKRRVDHPLQSPHPLLPELYELPPNRDLADVAGDLSMLFHDITYCDLCMTKIHGAWFRCAYCSSDMCDLHELDHNDNHCCIVFKAKVDLRALRTITNVEDPSKNTPLFGAVYKES